MVNPLLSEIDSIINGNSYASDNERVFTFIEFVKQFGYDNDPNIFVTAYKDYVTKWGEVKKTSITHSDDFVLEKMIDVLKSITLDYSTYEEQDFISHIDFTNSDQLKGLCALYSRKIKQISEFYRKKRNESSLIVKKNAQKGSTKSIQEVIYEKIFDYLFSDRNTLLSFKDIKRDLVISVENYVDTYSEYFDIPRKDKVNDTTRRDLLDGLLSEYEKLSIEEKSANTYTTLMSSANENDVDEKVFLDDSQFAISQILFSGNVHLEEIPLIAKVSVDLSQDCVGNMLMLKNQLTENLTTNQLDLKQQVQLKKDLYEKFLGVDLWYCYVDEQGNVTIDIMCQAKNPTGNLLNVLNADTATIERSEWDDVVNDGKDDYLELLSHIGLFFKPDKTSILKVNAKNFTWTIDQDVLINDTIYIFPDPNKYGDIGNNKSPLYPLIMECKLDNDIKNVSSGFAENDPLLYLGSQGWYSYYSKQEDDFKIFDNKNYDYSFTSLVNLGFAANYQTDIWGNEFCILKGCEISKEDGKKTLKIYSNYLEGGLKNATNDIVYTKEPILLNGGYFNDLINHGKPFNYSEKLTLIDNNDDKLTLSGFRVNNNGFYHPKDSNCIAFGKFGDHEGIKYTDHYHAEVNKRQELTDNGIINQVKSNFFTKQEDVTVEITKMSFEDIANSTGELYVKLLGKKPVKFFDLESFSFIKDVVSDEKMVNFYIVSNIIVLETENRYVFVQYEYDGENITHNLGVKELYNISKKEIKIKCKTTEEDKITAIDKTSLLYNESDNCFYLLLMETLDVNQSAGQTMGGGKVRRFVVPRIYKFDCKKYEMTDVLYPYESSLYYSRKFKQENIAAMIYFSERIQKKDEIVKNIENDYCEAEYFVKNVLISKNSENEYSNLSNFEIPYFPEFLDGGNEFESRFVRDKDKNLLNDLTFSYNSNLDSYLIAFTVNDMNNTPYLYQHSFKIGDVKFFNDSLVSKVYTIKDDGECYKWNNDFNPEFINVIPEGGTAASNIIWDSYAGTGKANTGFFYTDDWGFADDSPEINLTDFGGDNDNWKSYVYLWDDFKYKLLPHNNAKVIGKFEWEKEISSEFIENQDIDAAYFVDLKFRFFNLKLDYNFDVNDYSDVLTKEEASKCIDEYIYNILGELEKDCNHLNEPTITLDEEYVIRLYRDLLGNVSGSTHIEVRKKTNDKIIDIDICLSVSGTVQEITPQITIVAKQRKENKMSDVLVEEDIIGGNEDPSFSLSKKNITVYLHSEVCDFDDITGSANATRNIQKAIACDAESWSFTFGNPDGKAHIGTNNCRLLMRNLMVVECSAERDENGMPTKVADNGKKLYVKKTDSDANTGIVEFSFTLDIIRDDNEKITSNFSFDENSIKSNEITLADEDMTSEEGKIYLCLKSSDLPDNWGHNEKHFNDIQITPCYFNYDEGKLDIHLYSTIYVNSCNYKCWISYNKFGVPQKFNLNDMQNCSNMFGNTSSISLAWPLISDKDNNYYVRLESAKYLQNMCHASTCSRLKVRNDITENINSILTNVNKCFEFDIRKETETINEQSDALENVITARHTFMGCHPSLDGVLSRYMNSGIKNYNYNSNDLRQFAEAQQILVSACPENKDLYENNKNKTLSADEWKTEFWDKAKQNIKDYYNTNFNYNMNKLRNAESMFYKRTLHIKSSSTWPDETLNYTVEQIKTNNFQLQKRRTCDFDEIKIAAPKLISAPMMFWNRPLKIDEAQFFADNLQNLNDESMEFSNSNIQMFYQAMTGKTSPSIREVFDDVMKLYTYDKIYKVYKEDYNEDTKQTDINYYNWLDKWIKPIINSESKSQYWDKKINILNRLLTNNNCSPIKIKDNGLESTYYSGIFPSISLPFDIKSNDEYKDAWEIVKILADKGWEVSTNLTKPSNTEDSGAKNAYEELVSDGHTVIFASNDDGYLFRAYEYGGTSGETFMTDDDFKNQTTQKQDYLIDACKCVINPIICEGKNDNAYQHWIKLCMAWRNVSIASNWANRNSYNVSQILGETTYYGAQPGARKSKACIFTGNDNKWYCENTWYDGKIMDFKKHLGLSIIND